MIFLAKGKFEFSGSNRSFQYHYLTILNCSLWLA